MDGHEIGLSGGWESAIFVSPTGLVEGGYQVAIVAVDVAAIVKQPYSAPPLGIGREGIIKVAVELAKVAAIVEAAMFGSPSGL